MITTDWGTGYDVVVIAANFLFNIVSACEYRTAQQILIEKAAAALCPGGHLFIDYGYTLHPEKWFEFSGERVIFEGMDSLGTVGKMVLSDHTFDKDTGTCRFLRRYELADRNGKTFVEEIPEKNIFPCWKKSTPIFPRQNSRYRRNTGIIFELQSVKVPTAPFYGRKRGKNNFNKANRGEGSRLLPCLL